MADMKDYRLAGIIGLPVYLSRSPMIYRYWMQKYDRAGDYVLLPVKQGNMGDALRGLKALSLVGCNVTAPHKETAAKLVDRLDPIAKRMGAVNLIAVEQDGTLTGYNTDGYGFMQNLFDAKPDWDPKAAPAVVLGAGGGARSVVVSLLEAGVPEIRLVNRTRERAEKLRDEFGGTVTVCDWSQRNDLMAGAGLLTNTTNQGMTGYAPLDIALDGLPVAALVCDIIYNPLETALLAAARKRGNPAVNGLGMLLHQARPSFKAYFGIDPELTPDLRGAIEATIR